MIEFKFNFAKLQTKIKGYTKGNWGSPLIGGFIILLFASSIFSAIRQISIADTTANCAYFTLAAGVILQFIFYSKNRGLETRA